LSRANHCVRNSNRDNHGCWLPLARSSAAGSRD
jgi:hypothetical protein